LFRRYASWPKEVSHNISLMVEEDLLLADFYHALSRASSIAEYNATAYPELPKGAASAPVLVRAALGLPKRDS
jgi:hypothetical protein